MGGIAYLLGLEVLLVSLLDVRNILKESVLSPCLMTSSTPSMLNTCGTYLNQTLAQLHAAMHGVHAECPKTTVIHTKRSIDHALNKNRHFGQDHLGI